MEKVLDDTFHSLDIKQIIFSSEFVAKNQKIEFTKVDNDYVLSYQPDTEKIEDKKNLYEIMNTKFEDL